MINRLFAMLIALLVAATVNAAALADDDAPPMNVMLITVDDLATWGGAYQGRAKTPNMDRLGENAVLFRNAFAVVPACNPSRTALLTGQRPETTGQYENAGNFRDKPGGADRLTLPAFLKANGYETVEAGKIFHKHRGRNDAPDPQSDPQSWTYQEPLWIGTGGHPDYLDKNDRAKWLNGAREHRGYKLSDYLAKFGVWGPIDQRKEQTGDWKTAEFCADYVARDHDKPFFLACGIFRPHSPQLAPREYFDMYPLNEIADEMPPLDDLKDIHKGAQQNFTKGFSLAVLDNPEQWYRAVQGYKASVTFADDVVGKMIDALENSAYADNTILVVVGDHGFQHGTKDRWEKYSLWREATSAPLIIKIPGVAPVKVMNAVSFLDIFPTLMDYMAMSPDTELEGNSLRPLIERPDADWPHAAVVTYPKGNYSVVKDGWNYIRYENGEEELYNHAEDPEEWFNLLVEGKRKYRTRIDDMKQHLPR